MKTGALTLFILGICFTNEMLAQTGILDRQKENLKHKVNSRIENRIDQGVDKTLDKVEDKIDGSGKKKENQTTESSTQTETEKNSETNASQEGTENAALQNATKDEPQKSMHAYSKFDYIPGEKVLVFDQFESTEQGDFPINWNTNASAEVVKFDGRTEKFLKLSPQGIYQNEDIKALPENFTLDFDVFATEDYSEMMSGLKVVFVRKTDAPMMYDQNFSTETQFGMDMHPAGDGGTCYFWVLDQNNVSTITNEVKIAVSRGQFFKVSIWRQKNRVRVYINEQKIIDLPRALFPDITYESLFANYTFGGQLYMANIRFAVGAPDTRSKLITEGKLVSRGILFDTNSAKIKAESFGALKDIATVLLENPTVRVKIIGHTDSEGDDKANLDLSKKRAESVKETLIAEFKIPANQLETDGKGESEPTDPNTSSVGKANNRRVEFVKL
jgi:outer membrane protein OmpA-like peptidoglycan-associated protein